MKQVQAALKDIGVPVFAGIWRPTPGFQNPPPQYMVYSTTITEAAHEDDRVVAYKTFVYLNLWSDGDPTDTVLKVRKAMYDAGFFMVEESDKGYNHPSYDSMTRQFNMSWTWVLREEALP